MTNGAVQITASLIRAQKVSTKKIGKLISRFAFLTTLSVAMSVAGAAMAVPVSDLPDAGALAPFATFENFYNNKLLTIDRVPVSLGATTHLTRRIIPLGAIDHFGDLINGSLLVPGGAVTLARENGAIESRAKDIALMSGTTVASSCGTKPVPDVGSSLALMTIGLGFLVTLKRIFLS